MCATSASMPTDASRAWPATRSEQRAVAAMVGRFRAQAQPADPRPAAALHAGAAAGADQLPAGAGRDARAIMAGGRSSVARRCLSLAPQLRRADPARVHQRQSKGAPRVWRVGEPFETVARRFLPRAKPYSRWQARMLRALHVTKSLRSEYDHLMLQLHDGMKSDLDYQKNADAADRAVSRRDRSGCAFPTRLRMRSCRASTCWSRPCICPLRGNTIPNRARSPS